MAAPGRKRRHQIAALRSQSERGRGTRTWLQVSIILDQMGDGRSDAPFCLLRTALSLICPLPSSAFLHLRAVFRTFSGSRSKYHVRAAFRRCKESHQPEPIVPRPLKRSSSGNHRGPHKRPCAPRHCRYRTHYRRHGHHAPRNRDSGYGFDACQLCEEDRQEGVGCAGDADAGEEAEEDDGRGEEDVEVYTAEG